MHTAMILAAGFVLLGLCVVLGRLLAGHTGVQAGTLIFLPLWLLGAGINMYIGVTRGGYSVADESPIFLIVFVVPALAAWYIRSRPRHA